MSEARQTWCARCRWPGRAEFLVGTFTTDARAPDHEARQAAMREWADTMGAILPQDVAPPELLALIPGAVVFIPREAT